jgi:hypothetical protein
MKDKVMFTDELCKTGKFQSPTDLGYCHCSSNSRRELYYDSWNANQNRALKDGYLLFNTGYTGKTTNNSNFASERKLTIFFFKSAQLSPKSDDDVMVLRNGPLVGEYKFVNMHMHFGKGKEGSEHTVFGR